jgi:hypothetical protein
MVNSIRKVLKNDRQRAVSESSAMLTTQNSLVIQPSSNQSANNSIDSSRSSSIVEQLSKTYDNLPSLFEKESTVNMNDLNTKRRLSFVLTNYFNSIKKKLY